MDLVWLCDVNFPFIGVISENQNDLSTLSYLAVETHPFLTGEVIIKRCEINRS